ncbi:UDP:flavonoid glycosyltransferase YjiC (YdhE family) [Kordia periserrulae]|uniref:UDP:flavonoid glycosyltransferase YjiC (YdhE family) n=1 Tax=Kordia periserrulae TaxID=701523 RepID=A0A2T6C1H1_9FLAO|nr:glycosyltransferase [Kordia periserrulae]PTX62158.1 UDP:flavonoid glycosyltransferase YjiC (YdhE family) [Kordia periserrulae]
MKKAVLLFCDNDISHNIPMLGIAKTLQSKGHRVVFCGSNENHSFFQKQPYTYMASEIFDLEKQNVVNTVDLGFFDTKTLQGIAKGQLDSIMQDVQPDMILFSYYISYLLPFFKKKYNEIKYCCVNILMRGELFTPKFLYNFHYETASSDIQTLVKSILHTPEKDMETVIDETYQDFKEFILCPKEMDIDAKYQQQNVEYSEAIIGGNDLSEEIPEKNNVILFSMGSYSKQFPLVINKIVEKVIACSKLLREKDASYKFILSIPDGVLTNDLMQACADENINLVSWFDQNKLLYSSKLMITHGGIGSIKECIYAQTPMLCFPLTRDQPYNTKRIESLGLGKKLHPLESDVDEIFSALTDLLENDSYQTNLNTFRNIFNDYREKETLYNQLMAVAG